MTVGVAYRIPSVGAVLVSDGRVTHSGGLVSDSEKKYVVCGTTVCLVSGVVGPMWRKLQEKPPRSFAAFRDALFENEKLEEHEDRTAWLAYDRHRDQLWSGEIRCATAFATLGSGGDLARGALEALPAAKTLEDAKARAVTAVKIACKCNVECGGRLRILVVPRRGPIQVA